VKPSARFENQELQPARHHKSIVLSNARIETVDKPLPFLDVFLGIALEPVKYSRVSDRRNRDIRQSRALAVGPLPTNPFCYLVDSFRA
jgi:hypothetical protein